MTDAPHRRHLLQAMAAAPAGLAAPSVLDLTAALAQSPGGTLRVGMTVSAVPNSNGCPDQGGEGQRFMGCTLYDQLIMWDLSKAEVPAVLVPGLALRWEIDKADPKRWHFVLREGVRFHDGHVFTAEDVAFSLDRAFNREAPWFDARASAQALAQVSNNIAAWGVEAPDRAWIETRTIDGTLPYALTWLGIVHKGSWEAAGRDWSAYMAKAVGTGPWKLESFNQRERCVMVRNADYWDPKRVPKTERLVLLPLPDPGSRVAALLAGQVDFIEAPAPDAVPSLKAAGSRIVTNIYPHNWMWFLSQVPGSPWTDIRLRKAVNLGIDRSGLKELLGGLMVEGQGILPKGHPWYGHPTFALAYDPDAARSLVKEAGFGPGNPMRTRIAISSSGSGQMQPLAMNEFIQQNLREIGIEVELEVFEWQALIDMWKAGAGAPVARGCTALNISQGPFDPFRAGGRILQSDQISPKGVNWSKLNDPRLDALCRAAQASTDLPEQDRLLGEINALCVDQAYFLFAAHDLNPRAVSARVKGFVQAQSWFQDLTPIAMA